MAVTIAGLLLQHFVDSLTRLDDAIEELGAFGLTDLTAAQEGTVAAGHSERNAGRTQTLYTPRLFTCAVRRK